MKRVLTTFVLISLVCLMAGCAGDSRRQYVYAANTYAGTVDMMRTLHQVGALTPEETKKVDFAVTAGHTYLVQWKTALDANETAPPNVVNNVKDILDTLITIQIAKQKNE